LYILLSAAGIVGAQSGDVQADASRANEVTAVTPLPTAFTYQGQLKNGGNAVNGSCDVLGQSRLIFDTEPKWTMVTTT